MSQHSTLAQLTGQIGEPLIPRLDEHPNPLRPQLIEDRDKIQLVTTQQKTLIVTAGISTQKQLGFAAAVVTVHNATKYWWYLPDANIFIPPATINININFEIKPQTANIEFLSPTDYPQPAISDPSSFAVFVYGDKPLSPTTVIVPPAGGGAGSNVTVIGPVDGGGNVKVAVEGSVTTTPSGTQNVAITSPDDGSGNVKVAVQGTVPVNGTVTTVPSGTQAVSGVFWPATQPVSGTFWQATQPVSIAAPITANAASETPFTLISTATTNAQVIKASAAILKTIQIVNNNAAPIYLKIYNKASTPVPGTDTPVLNYEVPANGAGANLGGGFVLELNANLSIGLGIAITSGQALLNSSPVAAGDATLNMTYV